MILIGTATKIFLAAGPTDMRKSFEGLADLVRSRLGGDPCSGHLFVFVNRSKSRLKLLYFDGSGTWVCAKRLARGCFNWPAPDAQHAARQVVAEELALILGGIDLEETRRRPWWRKAA
jgi:transposase